MENNFIKIVDRGLAEQLANLGFQYIKESNGTFAFIMSDELIKILQETYSNGHFICENKLRF